MTQTSIKLKFRSSSVADREGTIIHNRKVRQLATNYHIYNNEWDGTNSMVTHSHDAERNHYLIKIKDSIAGDVERLSRIIIDHNRKGLPFDTDEIVFEYRRRLKEYSLFSFMQNVILQLKQIGKDRTSETYAATLSNFKQYRKGEDIMLDVITSEEMQRYEAYLINRGNCPNTTSFYMRILRSVYNQAVDIGATEQHNPFRHVYTGVSKTSKRAISINDIKRIKQLDLTLQPSLEIARDIFLFSFYTRGMAFVDMAYLRKKAVCNGIITYRRHKTGQILNIKVETYAQEIINHYDNPASDYIFPIIKTVGDEYHQYKNALRLINIL